MNNVLLAGRIDEFARQFVHRGRDNLKSGVRPGKSGLEHLDLLLQDCQAGHVGAFGGLLFKLLSLLFRLKAANYFLFFLSLFVLV